MEGKPPRPSAGSTPVPDLGSDELLPKYVCHRVVDRVLAAARNGTFGGEMCEATVMFVDIHGFSTLAERFDPERVMAVLNRNLAVVVDTVFEHDGAVLKFIGDGALVAFGVHARREDDARRAALAACEIHANLAELQAHFAAEERVRVAIGLHSGTVICGNVGHQERLDFTIVGDTVNVAARVQGLARAGEVLATESVVDDLDGAFAVDELEETTVKGRARPVRVFALRPRNLVGIARPLAGGTL